MHTLQRLRIPFATKPLSVSLPKGPQKNKTTLPRLMKKNSPAQQNKQPPSPPPSPPHPDTQTSSSQTPATRCAHTTSSPRDLSPTQTTPPATPASLPLRSRRAAASLLILDLALRGRRRAALALRWVRRGVESATERQRGRWMLGRGRRGRRGRGFWFRG